VLSKDERRRVAYHEMGHALVAASLPGVDPVQKVSIIPRGVGALATPWQRPTEDRFLLAASELKNRIAVLMGGRASEQMIFDGDVSTGAADDLQRATEIAVEMVTKYGMDFQSRTADVCAAAAVISCCHAGYGRQRGRGDGARDRSGGTRLIEEADTRARAILERRRGDLDAGVTLLIARETLTADEFAPLRSTVAQQSAAE